MKSKNIEAAEERTFERIAREQFDAFENQERMLSEDERAARVSAGFGQTVIPVLLAGTRKGTPTHSTTIFSIAALISDICAIWQRLPNTAAN